MKVARTVWSGGKGGDDIKTLPIAMTGKSVMLTAIADAYHREKGNKGFFACLMVPPSLTKKWPEEIREVLPDARVHVITNTEQLIQYHTAWTKAGRRKPRKPTFFVISFTTMRGDCAIHPATDYEQIATTLEKTDSDRSYYRDGYYCPDCGHPHQVVESTKLEMSEEGEEVKVQEKRDMKENEWGSARRLHSNNGKYQNAFCLECGASLWTKKTPNRYHSFKEWTKHENKVAHAAANGNHRLVKHLQLSQPDIPKQKGNPRRIASIEYIRRKMKNFFDMTLVDEIHELKSGMTAQGNSLGSLVAVSKKVVGATGTLFGGRAEDVYYLLWRLFPSMMVDSGFQYSNVRPWNEEFGNIETTTVEQKDRGEQTNKQSRGGTRRSEKVLPGISPFVFGKFLVHNSVLVRLVDVWPDPVELVNVPTMLVDMDKDIRSNYANMVSTFENEIEKRKDGKKLYLPLTQNGIAYPDNPFTYPDVWYRNEAGERERIWSALHIPEERLTNKEKKLQEIVRGEMGESRPSIVYVRDTGSSVKGRDVRPRLKNVLEQIGAKVGILDTSTTATNARSDWLRKKVEQEGYDVIIVSQELVKVGLDLLCTPTLIFYQFSWSLFTINQASRRAWRISQDRECRLFYIAYKDCYQEQMATLIAQKNKAASAINGEVSSDGLSAMLGDDGDLQSMLIKSIKNGETLKGSTEEWVNQSSDRARELLQGVGKKKSLSVSDQLKAWIIQRIETEATRNILLRKQEEIAVRIKNREVPGFTVQKDTLEVDLIEAFGFDLVSDGAVLKHLVNQESKPAVSKTSSFDASIFEVKQKSKKIRGKKEPVAGQLGFELF
ncbi:DEAD/DEAH box helicase [Gracilibacillus sp. YIM 98692]|uniref:helicase-related protein n=1 Tax=Gracilibacillus sp. YIM 98692 TaxID=2663532 RepID=UPI001969B67A|nr:DEAD/DEAH box helicase [Gracilibacillus sp. YIM 98692]